MAAVQDFPMTHQGVRDLDTQSRDKTEAINVGPSERAVSALGGAALTGFGLARGDMCGLFLAAVGGALTYRGVTGHCSAYAATGINTAQ
jgi:uncharacterized membrane protein